MKAAHESKSMKRIVVWSLAAWLVVMVMVMAFLPAAWMAPLVEQRSGGRIALGEVRGTVWHGSAFIGVASDSQSGIAPLLPGRFTWRLSALVLLGRTNMQVENRAALTPPVSITGTWRRWEVSPSSVLLPAERLAAFGAPLNTMRPSGQMRLSWQTLFIERGEGGMTIQGPMLLEMMQMASALSPVKPLGAYRLQIDWRGTTARLKLATTRGPLLLQGEGMLANGRLQFSGQAEAQEGKEERLAILLNLLGQRRQVGNKNIIALEFK